MTLKSDLKAARAAADKAVKDGESKEKQRKLAAVANELELKVQFEDWVKLQEEAGYTVVGDSFETALVSELPEGSSYDDRPGE
jgi:uncharacterized protein YqfA (UPF0365 family)